MTAAEGSRFGGTFANTQAQLAQNKIRNPNGVSAPGVVGPKGPQGYGASFALPFPNAPHDGGPQDTANTAAISDQLHKFNNYSYAVNNQPTLIDKVALGANVGLATAGLGAGLGLTAGTFGGGTAGAIGAGAANGALGGLVQSSLSGGKVGKNVLMGAAMGGVAGGMKPLINSAGITGPAGNIASSMATKELGGLISNGINGSPSGGSGHYVGGGGGGGGGASYLGAGAGAYGAGAMSGFGGQGNNGNMAGTDQTLGSTLAGTLPGVLQGAAGVYGAQNAAEKQTQADQHAIDTQTSTLGNIGNIWKTQQGLGQGADTSLGTALGTNGKPADYSGFENMPGYQFAIKQGTQAIQRQAASMGNAYTPNTAEAVGQYVTGTAMQDYNTYISQLMGAAGLGNEANKGISDPTMRTGENISQLQVNQGHAQASGVSGAANSVGGLFGPNGAGSSLIGRYLNGGNGGGNGGGIGSPVRGAGGGNLFQGPQSNWNNTGAGNGTWGSGYDPNTGGSWVGSGATDISPFDNTTSENPIDWTSTPSMPGIDSSTDFGGGMDYGADSGGMDFLGGWG